MAEQDFPFKELYTHLTKNEWLWLNGNPGLTKIGI